MKSKCVLTLAILLALFGFCVESTPAQKVDGADGEKPIRTCSSEPFVMPPTISTDNTVFADYVKFASLSKKSRMDAFADLAPQQKAVVMRTRLAMLLVTHPDLTMVQMEYISNLISVISPEMYQNGDQLKRAIELQFNTEVENKALALFPRKIAFEILEGIGTDQSEYISLIQKYENLLLAERSTRKKLAAEMPLNDRIAIWKTQLAYHLITATLNKDQRTLLIEMFSEIRAIFSASAALTGAEKDAYVNVLEGRIFKVFTKAEAFAIFMTVGIHKYVSDKTESGTASVSLGEKRDNALKTPSISIEGSPWSCDCRFWCDKDGQSCSSDNCNVATGCGPFATWDCIYRCMPIPSPQ